MRLRIEAVSKRRKKLIVEIHAMRCEVAFRNREPSQLRGLKKKSCVNNGYGQAHV